MQHSYLAQFHLVRYEKYDQVQRLVRNVYAHADVYSLRIHTNERAVIRLQ